MKTPLVWRLVWEGVCEYVWIRLKTSFGRSINNGSRQNTGKIKVSVRIPNSTPFPISLTVFVSLLHHSTRTLHKRTNNPTTSFNVATTYNVPFDRVSSTLSSRVSILILQTWLNFVCRSSIPFPYPVLLCISYPRSSHLPGAMAASEPNSVHVYETKRETVESESVPTIPIFWSQL